MGALVKITRKKKAALFLSILLGAGSGCGVVYTPQEFEESNFNYGYKGNFETAIDVVPMTFTSARLANSDDYIPKSLPGIFSESDPIANVSTRERLAASGLDTVEPALILNPLSSSAGYREGDQILPPAQRNAARQPINTPLPSDIPLAFPPKAPATSSQQPYVTSRTSTELPAFSSDADFTARLERPQVRRHSTGKPIPNIEPGPYRIGPGDVLSLDVRSLVSTDNEASQARQLYQQLLVQDNNQIFLPNIGPITIGGLTLNQMRQVISEQFVASTRGLNPGVQIVKFGSKSIAVSGLTSSRLIPLTIRPKTLGEAIVEVGGFGASPENTIVRVLRQGTIYEMSGDELLGSDQYASRILIDGDVVSITSGYNPESALAYFDQQVRLRQIERSRYEDAVAARNEERAVLQEERLDAQEARLNAAESRSVADVARQQFRLDIELRNYRLETDRLRREAEIARFQAQRETDQLNEDARIANIAARQAFLDRVRELRELNREIERQTLQDARETQIANQTERARERSERRELLELELQEERLRLQQIAETRQQNRALFSEKVRLGAVAQDHVTVAGETKIQTTMPLPFNGRLTLNRVLYEKTNGIDLLSGDTSEIYVIRTPQQDRIADKVIAYHLNATNPAALAVASIFEMRPNDVVYVNPQPITKWNRVLTQLLPSTGLLQSGLTATTLGN